METFDFITHFRKVKKNLVPSRQSVVGMKQRHLHSFREIQSKRVKQ